MQRGTRAEDLRPLFNRLPYYNDVVSDVNNTINATMASPYLANSMAASHVCKLAHHAVCSILILSLVTTGRTSAFHIGFIPTSRSAPSTASSAVVDTPNSNVDESLPEIDIPTIKDMSNSARDERNNNDDVFELWLDLRGTKLTPKSVSELWSIEEQDQQFTGKVMTNSDPLHKPPPFARCLVSSKSLQIQGSSSIYPNDENNKNVMEVLLVEDDTDDIETDNNDNNDNTKKYGDSMKILSRQYSSSSQSADVIGKLLPLQTSSSSSSSLPMLPDPLPAMEVASQGQWMILDTHEWKKVKEDQRTSMLMGLVELIYSGVTNDKHGGGIGWTCHTNTEIVKAAMWIQSMNSSSNGAGSSGAGKGNTMRTKTTESGFVVPDYSDDFEMEDGMNESLFEALLHEDRNSDPFKFAIIVPYDVRLLRTVMMLIDKSEDSNDDDSIY